MARYQAYVSPGERAANLGWIRELRTKSGQRRDRRVRVCGRLTLGALELAEGDASKWVPGVTPKWCRDRACPTCDRRSAAERAWMVNEHMAGLAGATLMLTLTQARRSETPEQAIARLNDSWTKTRQNRQAVKRALARPLVGLFCSLEVEYSPHRKGDWHPHLHVLVTAPEPWELAHLLRDAWLHYSKGADPDAQDISAPGATVHIEVTKYVTKGNKIPMAYRARLFRALAGKRLFRAAGVWRGWADHRREGPRLSVDMTSLESTLHAYEYEGYEIDHVDLGRRANESLDNWRMLGKTLAELRSEVARAAAM